MTVFIVLVVIAAIVVGCLVHRDLRRATAQVRVTICVDTSGFDAAIRRAQAATEALRDQRGARS